MSTTAVKEIGNLIDGETRPARSERWFEKLSPATGELIARVARSQEEDALEAIEAARRAQPAWAQTTLVERGNIIRKIALILQERAEEIARVVAKETGKSFSDALGETGGAVEMGFFVAGEGRRFYGKTTTSAVPNKAVSIVRQPLGVAALITAANTPIANAAWKAFPAILCGNAAILKGSEGTPETTALFGEIAREAGVPAGVLNVLHGFGPEAGEPLLSHPDVAVVSFTGSREVGSHIQVVAGKRLAKVCLELGGKNALIVCDDADLDGAAEAVTLSAFSNAGQRCAACSRTIVFDSVYDRFCDLLIERTKAQSVGPNDDNDFGPVINEGGLNQMLDAVARAREAGAKVLTGGERLSGDGLDGGFYMAPTVLEDVELDAEISKAELFGPITNLYRVAGFEEAIEVANNSSFGLTAAIWTTNIHRAQIFATKIQAGMAVVNGPTYGSEPHMPFGGQKDSGTGWREAGTEALDVYSDWKTISIIHDPTKA